MYESPIPIDPVVNAAVERLPNLSKVLWDVPTHPSVTESLFLWKMTQRNNRKQWKKKSEDERRAEM
jgi:hypothetical protein